MKKKIVVLFILLCSMLACVNSAEAYSNQDNKIYNKAYSNFVNGDYQGSIVQLRKLVEKYPNDMPIFIMFLTNYVILCEYDVAEQIFGYIVKTHPQEAAGYSLLADLYADTGNIPFAVKYYDKVLSLPGVDNETIKTSEANRKKIIDKQIAYDKQISLKDKSIIDVNLNLDAKKWYNAFASGSKANWSVEYGLTGEDVTHYKWTKLVSVDFYNKSSYNLSLDIVYEFVNSQIRKQALFNGYKDAVKKLSEDENNIYYEWSIPNLNESEIGRLYKHANGIYYIRYAVRQSSISAQQRESILKFLKNVTVKK